MQSRFSPRAVTGTALVVLVAASVSACTVGADADPLVVSPQEKAVAPAALDPSDPASAAITASESLFERSELAIVVAEGDVDDLADAAAEAGAPLLIDGPGIDDELKRLGVTTVAHAGEEELADLDDGIEQVAIDPESDADGSEMPRVETKGDPAPAVLFTSGAEDGPPAAAVATLKAAGGTVEELPGGDPRASEDTVALARKHADHTVLLSGDAFGPPDGFAKRLELAATAKELPGGGMLPLRDRLLVATYGHPGAPVLGVLGETDLDGAVRDVQDRAAQYESLTDKRVVPTFELITTVASAHAGEDGDYSDEADPSDLVPWIERAQEEGIYVVLDLQPGRSSFTDQVTRYEELLEYPNVGLALDPEWRLEPDQHHLTQIGHVGADEVNATADWLADLTAENDLPQKLFVLHQFQRQMLRDRDTIDTTHDELQTLVHVDGNGAPGAKRETWDSLMKDLPDGMALGWKNFIDEDTPMFTPEQTMEIEPEPSLITYQ